MKTPTRPAALLLFALLGGPVLAPARAAGAPPAPPPAAASDVDAAVRLARIEQAMWERDRAMIPALRTWAAGDPDDRVRERSLGALALLGDGGAGEEILARLEQDPSARVRRAAAEAVWVLGIKVPPTRLTVRYEKDPDPLVRAECARALGRSGQRSTAPSLMNRLVNDPSPGVRAVTAEALALLQVSEAFPLLRYAAGRDPSPLVQLSAARALADAGDAGAAALFRDLWESTRDADLRVEAFRGLLRSGAPGDWISAGLADGDDRIRFLAFEHWLSRAAPRAGAGRRDPTTSRLEAFLSDPLPGIRDLAREALERMGYRVRPSGLTYTIEE